MGEVTMALLTAQRQGHFTAILLRSQQYKYHEMYAFGILIFTEKKGFLKSVLKGPRRSKKKKYVISLLKNTWFVFFTAAKLVHVSSFLHHYEY